MLRVPFTELKYMTSALLDLVIELTTASMKSEINKLTLNYTWYSWYLLHSNDLEKSKKLLLTPVMGK